MSHNVLVLEDETDLREVIVDLFKASGFNKVKEAGSLAEARNILLSPEEVDIYISDLKLPDGSGKDLVEEIKSLGRLPKITLFFSGFSTYTKEELENLGVSGVLNKPFDLEILIQTVREKLALI